MSETNDNLTAVKSERKLADAMRTVKNAAADRSDVVIDMRDAERMRLELLAHELTPVIADVPHDTDLFDFALSSGLQPRFWVDAVAHVAMGRDKRTYRFVRDTRNGRVVIKEDSNLKPVADAVTHYVAERMVERERMMDGGEPVSFRETETVVAPKPAPAATVEIVPAPTSASPLEPAAAVAPSALAGAAEPAPQAPALASSFVGNTTSDEIALQPAAKSGFWPSLWWAVAIFLLGGAIGFGLMASQMWDQLIARLSAL